MRITIDLPDDAADQLSREAANAGLPLAEHIVRVLGSATAATTLTPLTGAELVEYWTREGLIGSRPDIDDPVEFARALRTQSSDRVHRLTEP